MKSPFIKSSAKVKADPLYYKRKADRWAEQRNALFEEVDRIEAAAGHETRESLAIHARAMQLSAKVQWACLRIGVAQGMREGAKR